MNGSVARARLFRASFKDFRVQNAATLLQSLLRARYLFPFVIIMSRPALTLVYRAVRNAFLVDRRRVVLLQSCVRRRQAKKELGVLKHEARSATHFKEVSYKLENKVVELTQTLQKRTTENRALQSKLRDLEGQLQNWMSKYDEADAKAQELRAETEKSTVTLPEFQELESQKRELDSRLEESLSKISKQDAQIQKLTEQFEKQTAEMEKRQKVLNSAASNGVDDSATISALRAELASLREQLSRAVAVNNVQRSANRSAEPPTFNMNTGKPQENGFAVATNGGHFAPAKRRPRRHSMSGVPSDPVPQVAAAEFAPDHADNFRAVSMAFTQETDRQFRVPGTTAYYNEPNYEEPSEAVMRLLEEEEPLDEDVLVGIIRQLKIPAPSSQHPPSPKEVLFPAHLISLITNEMWKYGFLRESERFLANVMQTVQQHVMVR
jgi:myosin-5